MVYQFCEHENDVVQVNAELNHKCPKCGAIMTFGKWSNRVPDKLEYEHDTNDQIIALNIFKKYY